MREITDLKLIRLDELIDKIFDENSRQIDKWGVQERTPSEWMLYLTEEVGELAEAIAEREYRYGDNEDVVKEAVQVATLVMKIAEMYMNSPINNSAAGHRATRPITPPESGGQ